MKKMFPFTVGANRDSPLQIVTDSKQRFIDSLFN
jgi:hypothetical protein